MHVDHSTDTRNTSCLQLNSGLPFLNERSNQRDECDGEELCHVLVRPKLDLKSVLDIFIKTVIQLNSP